MTRHSEHIVIGGDIPTLVWRGDGEGRRPAIVRVHGNGGRKEDTPPEWVERAASRGVSVVAIDAHLHGERNPGVEHPRTLDKSYQLRFLDIVGHTARDLESVVAWVRDDGGSDGERVGLWGVSMGGYIVLAASGLGVPARAVLSVSGGASYADVWPGIFADRPDELPGVEALMDEIAERACAFDPIYRAHRFPPRSLAMIHGERDSLVPVRCARQLYEALVPYYADRPGECMFLSHAGDHDTATVLWEWGWDWLVERVHAE